MPGRNVNITLGLGSKPLQAHGLSLPTAEKVRHIDRLDRARQPSGRHCIHYKRIDPPQALTRVGITVFDKYVGGGQMDRDGAHRGGRSTGEERPNYAISAWLLSS
jgi:hypothetical protein